MTFVAGQPLIFPPIPQSGFETSDFNHAAIYLKAPIMLKPN